MLSFTAAFAPFIPTTQKRHYSTPSHAAHRNIVILSHNVSDEVANGFFDVNNLLQGRLDVLARCASSALWVSNGIRKDCTVFLMLSPQNQTIEIQGSTVRGLNPNEKTMALYLQRTLLIGGSQEDFQDELARLEIGKGNRPATVNPFKPGGRAKSEKQRLRVGRKANEARIRRIKDSVGEKVLPAGFLFHKNETLQARLVQFAKEGPIFMLDEGGELIGNVFHKEQQHDIKASTTTLILANQVGYAASDEKLLLGSSKVQPVSLGPLSLLTSQCITIAHHYLDNAVLLD